MTQLELDVELRKIRAEQTEKNKEYNERLAMVNNEIQELEETIRRVRLQKQRELIEWHKLQNAKKEMNVEYERKKDALFVEHPEAYGKRTARNVVMSSNEAHGMRARLLELIQAQVTNEIDTEKVSVNYQITENKVTFEITMKDGLQPQSND